MTFFDSINETDVFEISLLSGDSNLIVQTYCEKDLSMWTKTCVQFKLFVMIAGAVYSFV